MVCPCTIVPMAAVVSSSAESFLKYYFPSDTVIGGAIDSINARWGDNSFSYVLTGSILVGAVGATYAVAPATVASVLSVSNIVKIPGYYVIGDNIKNWLSAIYDNDTLLSPENFSAKGLISHFNHIFHAGKDYTYTKDTNFTISLSSCDAVQTSLDVALIAYKIFYPSSGLLATYSMVRAVGKGIEIGVSSFYGSTYKEVVCETECCTVPNPGTDEVIISQKEGGKIFGKGGLDKIYLNNDFAEKVYFSMCSTKIVPGLTPDFDSVVTVYNFNPPQDHLVLFCTKKNFDGKGTEIKEVSYNPVHDFTYIGIGGIFNETGIALQGYYSEEDVMGSIVYNERYAEVC